MARAPKPTEEAELLIEPVTEMITYVPGPMDPSTIKWCGHTFHANVPKEITGRADGSERERLSAHLIERARENKFFTVGNAKPKRDVMPMPTTAEAYRAYLVDWLKDPSIEHVEQLIARFAQDRNLRAACEVGSDDYSYIATLFLPKLHELTRMDELQPSQVAAIWASHGFNETPW